MSSEAQAKPTGLNAYIAVTAAYWAFMLTDGALRMLVLLHFHTLGFSPIQLAYLFLLYEFMGMVTNLSAGWLATRFGLTATLYAGMSLQIVALLALTLLDPGWSVAFSVSFVMLVQGLSGIAKDLTKMSSKSAVKLLAPSENDGLFRWVAMLTGLKNAIKGLGFLLGAVLLAVFGFLPSIVLMAGVLTVILVGVVVFMPAGLSGGIKGAKFSQIFSRSQLVNRLSAARVFLFGARDVWFVVGIPIYFYSVLSDGGEAGNRAAFFTIGTFMAVWIIAYGLVQAFAPKFLKSREKSVAQLTGTATTLVAMLALIPAFLAVTSFVMSDAGNALTVILITGLVLFGIVFALNSSLHSYLILAFSHSDSVKMDIGFYYMSNAAGRLIGTLLSGLSYQLGGLTLCLATACAMVLASWVSTMRLRSVVQE